MQRALRACRSAACAAAVLWPGAAFALGDEVAVVCGPKPGAAPEAWAIVGALAAAVCALTALAWGAHRLWQRHARKRADFSFAFAATVVTGLMLVATGLLLSPALPKVYAGFGVELPWLTRLLMDYPFLLSVPLILFPFLLLKVEHDRHREQYFAAFAVLEFVLLCLAAWALDSPIVIAC